jgi:hypothetical protein
VSSIGKRTGFDFINHDHRLEIYKNNEGKEIRVDHFQVGSNSTFYIQFINTDRVLTVTGDFGNWVFCRPFVPSSKGFVSEGYWIEKLKLKSCQSFDRLDSDGIREELNRLYTSGLKEYGLFGEELEDCREWISELKGYCDNQTEYLYHAFYDPYKPDGLDLELIPEYKHKPRGLDFVFDSFDIICERMKKGEIKDE